METINSILYTIAIWSIIGGFVYWYLVVKRPDMPRGWCKVATLVCGPLAWLWLVLWLIGEDMGKPEAWTDTEQ